MAKIKYYTLDRILKENANYYMIIGERSNGKTFSVENYCLKDFCKNGRQMALIRRWGDDFTGKRGQQMFDALVNNGLVEKYTDGKWNNIYYYSARWYLSKWDNDKGKLIRDEKPFCYAFSLNAGEHDKSTSYPNVYNILFDEFITRQMYLTDEFVLFQNTISTIVRERNADDFKIFMCGNTVNKYCPYFTEMGLTNIRAMEKDQIQVYQYGEEHARVAVEYASMPAKSKKSDKLFAFNNPKLKMITEGKWEIAVYPLLPVKYTKKNVLLTYFIQFMENIVQCEIIQVGNNIFTYIHAKTSPYKQPEKDIIFSCDYNPLPNWRRRITKPYDEIGKKIYSFFILEKVFYQNNEIGEVVRNYLNWSKEDKGIT